MSNDKITITDAATGETIERPMSDEEQATRNAFLDEVEAEAKAKAEQDAKAATDKASATTKLEALGLTADDLKALGL